MAEEVSGCETFEVVPVPLIMNYPRTERVELPVGVTKINVKTRQVFLPDGTIGEMYAPAPIETCKSFLIYTDAEFDMRASLNGKIVYTSTVFPLWTRSKVLEFDELEIETTAKTMFYIAMSNVMDAMASIEPVTTIITRRIIETDPAAQFTDGLAVGSEEDENLIIAANKIYLTNIAVISSHDRYYQLQFFVRDTVPFADLDYIGQIDFDLPTYGVTLKGGYRAMHASNVDLDYRDMDVTKRLHTRLVNLGPGAKLAYPGGVVKFIIEYGERL